MLRLFLLSSSVLKMLCLVLSFWMEGGGVFWSPKGGSALVEIEMSLKERHSFSFLMKSG